jgi:hypothetical protein
MISTVLSGGAVAVVGSTVLGQVVSGTLNGIYSTLSYLKNGSIVPEYLEHVNSHLRRLDLEMKIAVSNEILSKENKTTTENIVEHGMTELLHQIENVLQNIHKQLDDHQHKWFASYRTLPIAKELAQLDELTTILDKRLDIIIKLSAAHSNFNSNSSIIM